MSNNKSLTTIDHATLDLVNGGGTDRGHVEVHAPTGAGGTVDGEHSQTGYETCLAYNRQQAMDAYPDTRNLWDYLTFQPDRNGRARADYERRGLASCGRPTT